MDPITIGLLVAGGFLLRGVTSSTQEAARSVSTAAADAALNAPVLHLSAIQLAAIAVSIYFLGRTKKE